MSTQEDNQNTIAIYRMEVRALNNKFFALVERLQYAEKKVDFLEKALMSRATREVVPDMPNIKVMEVHKIKPLPKPAPETVFIPDPIYENVCLQCRMVRGMRTHSCHKCGKTCVKKIKGKW